MPATDQPEPPIPAAALPGSAPRQPSVAWPDTAHPLPVNVIKLAPDGSFVTDYPGILDPAAAALPWVAIRAVWDNPVVVVDGLEFHPGDVLIEYFSPDEWFNVFAVHDGTGSLRGWYANVTYPARFDASTNPPSLTWHDLFVDVVARPGCAPTVRDEDELADSGLAVTNPPLARRIFAVRDHILDHLERRIFPFGAPPSDEFAR